MKRIAIFTVFLLVFTSIVFAFDHPDFGNIAITTLCKRAGGKWTGNQCIKEGNNHITLKEALGKNFEIIRMPDGRWLFAKKPIFFLYLGPPLSSLDQEYP